VSKSIDRMLIADVNNADMMPLILSSLELETSSRPKYRLSRFL
jgi:hypothetical protein